GMSRQRAHVAETATRRRTGEHDFPVPAERQRGFEMLRGFVRLAFDRVDLAEHPAGGDEAVAVIDALGKAHGFAPPRERPIEVTGEPETEREEESRADVRKQVLPVALPGRVAVELLDQRLEHL